MTPYYADDWLTVYQGDARDVLPSLPRDSVDCIVTSPPYWGLRDYGNDGQLGLEATPEQYVANLVAVFRELRRILKPTGTCFLNLGDSFLPGKQMAGVPWRVAFALQADGWYLRSDIIWSKPNPMPESVTDRPTKSHEYIFLLTKSPRYFFDADAVREAVLDVQEDAFARGSGRNIRSVWTIATRPYPGAHFAVFPPELPERCIKAGSSERGVCPECGAPWERVVERTAPEPAAMRPKDPREHLGHSAKSTINQSNWHDERTRGTTFETTGWRSTCEGACDGNVTPSVVLDPFAGSGTTGMVANRLSRRAILIDLNADYLRQQMARNAQTPLGLGA